MRSGTFDVAAVAGFAAALEVAVRDREAERQRVGALRDRLVDARAGADPGARVHGPVEPRPGLPGVANIAFPGCQADVAADAARRGRHRLLDRLGLLGRRVPAQPCADRDGRDEPRRPLVAALLPRPHLDGGRCGCAAQPPCPTAVERAPPRARVRRRLRRREGAGRDVRRRRLRGRRRPGRRRRPRRDRGAPRAVQEPAVLPVRSPWLLLPRGRPRRPARRRRARDPLLRLGSLRPVRGRRGRRLRRRVRRRPHPEPVPALQREDQVRRGARPRGRARLRRGLHRALRPAGRAPAPRCSCTARSTAPRTSPTCSAC